MTKAQKRAKAREYQKQWYHRNKKQQQEQQFRTVTPCNSSGESKSETKEYKLNYCPNCGVHLDHIDIW